MAINSFTFIPLNEQSELRKSDFFFLPTIVSWLCISHRYLTWYIFWDMIWEFGKLNSYQGWGLSSSARVSDAQPIVEKVFSSSFTSAAAVLVEMWNPFFFIYDRRRFAGFSSDRREACLLRGFLWWLRKSSAGDTTERVGSLDYTKESKASNTYRTLVGPLKTELIKERVKWHKQFL